jgi:uncharacterized protein
MPSEPFIRPLTPEDQPALEAFLKTRLASSMFLLSNVRYSGIVEGGERFQGTYVGAFDRDNLVGVAAHYWNGNVMTQTSDDLALAPMLAREAVRGSGRVLKGIVGDGAQSLAVVRDLQLQASQFQLYEIEGLYRLSFDALNAKNAPPLAVNVRRATESDRDTLVIFYRDYNVEALNETDLEQALANAREHVTNCIESGSQFVLDVNGEVFAASTFNARVDIAVQVGGVWTPHALRGRGYARACVAGSLAIAAQEGFREAILFTGDNNVPAKRSYAAIGFRRIGDFFIGLLREPLSFNQ